MDTLQSLYVLIFSEDKDVYMILAECLNPKASSLKSARFSALSVHHFAGTANSQNSCQTE